MLSCINADWRIIHSYNIVHQKDMMNSEDIIRIKSVLLNIKKQLTQVSTVLFLRKQLFRAVAPCGWVICSRSLGKSTAFISKVSSQSMDSTLKMEGVLIFETLRRDKPTKRCNIPEDLISQYQNRFALIKSFIAVLFPGRKSGDLPATPAVSIRYGNLSCFSPLLQKRQVD
jgi:hypothetical protein